MTIPAKIGKVGANATQLRDRVLAQMNGEARSLSAADRARRKQLLAPHQGGSA